jgi:hypothetical protein
VACFTNAEAPCLQMLARPYNKTFNVLVKDADWKSKASMTASYDFAMVH